MHTMVKSLFFVLALSLCGLARGDWYQWTGADEGEWNSAGNWSLPGVPGAGDTAYFTKSVRITDGIAIGVGTLTVTNAIDTDLELVGVISGAGALAKLGSGRLILRSANTFAGGFTVIGNGDAGETRGEVVAYDGAAFGSGPVAVGNLDGTTAASNCRLNLVGPMTVANDFQFGPDDNSIGQGTLYMSGGVRFTGSVAFTSRSRFLTAGDGSTFTFDGPVSNAGSYFMPMFGSGTDALVYNSTVSVGSFYGTSGNVGTLWLNGKGKITNYWPGNKWSVTCGCADAVTASSGIKFAGRLDLNGHDQSVVTTGRKWTYGFDSEKTAVVTSPADRPALFSFSGLDYCPSPAASSVNKTNFIYQGVLSGSAGLCWNPLAASVTTPGRDIEFVFSKGRSETCGTLIVSNGAMRVTDGAGFPALGAIEVRNAAKFVVDASAADVMTGDLRLDADARLHLAADKTLVALGATVGGQALAAGFYTGGEDGSPVFGEGRLQVIFNGSDARRRVWTGEAADGDWSNAANWDGGTPPVAGEDLFVDAKGAKLILGASTPAYGQVVLVDATLVWTNFTTCLTVSSLTVGAGSVLTTSGPFADERDKSRVWIACGGFFLCEGGCVDVDARGWSCGQAASSPGYGPGAGRSTFAASHGGTGGVNPAPSDAVSRFPPACYDTADEPVEPGSGGYRGTGGETATHGGGAVRIEATGEVRVDGRILASGGSVKRAGSATTSSYKDTAGSGGSVWISCAHVSGYGEIRAEGGNGSDPRSPGWDNAGIERSEKPAGGGRIAISYGSAQTVSEAAGLTVSARAGVYDSTACPLALCDEDRYRNSAELGTVWFSDAKLVAATLGRGLSGRIANPSGYVSENGLDFTDGWVRFEGEGVSVRIAGDLSIAGASARLEVGGVLFTNRASNVSMTDVWAGRQPVGLAVDGDLSVSGGGRLDIRAAETNGVEAWGAKVTVGGDFTVGAGGVVVPWSDSFNLGSPCFTAGGDFTVAAGGRIVADRRGGAGALSGTWYRNNGYDYSKGKGIGGGGSWGGGGHGGAGGCSTKNSSATYVGKVCDDPLHPTQPGSGGGDAGYGEGGAGGGIVHVTAGGRITVDGAITADGGYSSYATEDYFDYNQSGSGGTVYLYGTAFAGTGFLSAKGGDAPQGSGANSAKCAAAGGGGRIAVWCGPMLSEATKLYPAQNPSAIREYAFTGEICVAGGTNHFIYSVQPADRPEIPEKCRGAAGTVSYAEIRPKPGLMMILR